MMDVTIVGFGNVGSALSLLLLNNARALRLNIMEPDEQREGAFLDLAHGIHLYHEKELFVNNEELFLQADVIFFTAGTPNVHGGSRLSTAKQNSLLAKEIFAPRTFVKTPWIIVITNPVDIVTQAVQRYSGVPASRVVGTGTFLDSVRLAHSLSSLSNHSAADFDAVVLGEHGASQVPIYSLSKLNGKAILDLPEFTPQCLDRAYILTRDAAFHIRETQKGTLYGVAKCAEVLMNFLLDEETHVLTLSALTNAYYRDLLNLEKDIYISMPVVVKNKKIELINNIDLLDSELEAYRKSAAILCEVLEDTEID